MATKTSERTSKELDSLPDISCGAMGTQTPMNYSTTYATALVALAGALGLKLSSDDLSTTISVLMVVGSFLYHLVLRYKKGGIHWTGVKK